MDIALDWGLDFFGQGWILDNYNNIINNIYISSWIKK